VSGENHNAAGRTSLARQGDGVGVCPNPQRGAREGASMAFAGCISRPSPSFDGPLCIGRAASMDSTTANCFQSLLPDRPSRDNTNRQQPFYSIPELAVRWRCSRGTVYNRLRFAGAKVLDFATGGRKGKKLVPALTVFQIESKYLKTLT